MENHNLLVKDFKRYKNKLTT